jgi:hypothetical protein
MTSRSPYTVKVVNTGGGVALCAYFDAEHQPVPAEQPLTTETQAGLPGELIIGFAETVVEGTRLRLVGAAVKTRGHEAALDGRNYLVATRSPGATSGEWVDAVVCTWRPGSYTLRGVVLLFAEVDDDGQMLSFLPSTDPQIKNEEA